MNKIIIAVIVFLLVVSGVWFFFIKDSSTSVYETNSSDVGVDVSTGVANTADNDEGATTTTSVNDEMKPEEVIGESVDRNEIVAYHFGTGDTEVMFIGGIHGGYSWNTALVAYELIDYLKTNESVIPDNVMVTVIPNLNPDGLEAVTGKTGVFSASDVQGSEAELVASRFNTNEVDLNRNFDCEWESTGTWQSQSVNGGSAPFSEPESQAIKTYVERHEPAAVIAWYSSAGGVYSSSCKNGILPKTTELTNLYADASGYPAYKEFDFYEITGDMVNWLAAKNVPAISVLLTTHDSTEWSKNKAGIEAVLTSFAN